MHDSTRTSRRTDIHIAIDRGRYWKVRGQWHQPIAGGLGSAQQGTWADPVIRGSGVSLEAESFRFKMLTSYGGAVFALIVFCVQPAQ